MNSGFIIKHILCFSCHLKNEKNWFFLKTFESNEEEKKAPAAVISFLVFQNDAADIKRINASELRRLERRGISFSVQLCTPSSTLHGGEEQLKFHFSEMKLFFIPLCMTKVHEIPFFLCQTDAVNHLRRVRFSGLEANNLKCKWCSQSAVMIY